MRGRANIPLLTSPIIASLTVVLNLLFAPSKAGNQFFPAAPLRITACILFLPKTFFQHHEKHIQFPLRYALLLALCLMFSGLFAQSTDIFYRAWAQTGANVAPGFNNTVSAAGPSGTTYIATSTLNSSNTHSVTLSKHSSVGALLWSAVFAVNTGGNAYVGGLALDPSGNVLVTGSTYNGSTPGYDLFTFKYSSTGSLL